MEKISPKKAAWIQGKINAIKTVSHMPLTPDGTVTVCLDDISPEQKEYLGSLIKITLLNAHWAGKVKFWLEDLEPMETVFPEVKNK